MGSKTMTLVKYLLFTFNLIFALSGLMLIVIGAVIQSGYDVYDHFMDSRFFTAPIMLIIVGIIVFLVASFGCCGAITENRCVVMTFSILLGIIFVLELAAGIAGYVLKDDLSDAIKEKMNDGLEKYAIDESASKAWNILQHDFQCCGLEKPEDWKVVFHNDSLPWSCCSPNSNATVGLEEPRCSMGAYVVGNVEESGVYESGCLSVIVEKLQHSTYILGGVGIGIAFIQIFGIALSCCLAKSIQRAYESV